MGTSGTVGTVRMAGEKRQPAAAAVRVGIVKRCPGCGRRLCDKLTDCHGIIAIKCPKCGRVSEIDMALRLGRCH